MWVSIGGVGGGGGGEVVRDDGRMDDGRVDQGSEGSEGEEDDEEVVNIEFVGCSYLDCVGAVDHMMMLESFYNYFEIEASDRAKLIGEKIEEKLFLFWFSLCSQIFIYSESYICVYFIHGYILFFDSFLLFFFN